MVYNALPTLIDAPNPPPQINTRRHIVNTPVKRKKRKSYKINNNSLINILKQNLILIADKHVDLNSFSKMRVNLATQLLSQSVASGIRTIAILTKQLSKDSLYTADFCEFFNNLFDIFNSTDLNTSNPYKSVLVPNSISLDFLNNALNILNSITYNGSRYTNSLPCLLGWKCNVIAVLNLFDHLRSHYSNSKSR